MVTKRTYELERDGEYYGLKALHSAFGGLGIVCEPGRINQQHGLVRTALEEYFNLYFDNHDNLTAAECERITRQLAQIKERIVTELRSEAQMVDEFIRLAHTEFPTAPADLEALLARNLAEARKHLLTEILPRYTLAYDAWHVLND